MTATRICVRRCDEVLASLPRSDWLSPSETVRLDRLTAPSRRRHYIAGHWLLRQLLAPVLGIDAVRVVICERPNLPPAIDGSGLCVSLSHSGEWVAAAISATAIGIDLESRPRDLSSLQRLLLNPDERSDQLDADELLQRWVIKEAWLKRDHRPALPENLASIAVSRCNACGDVAVHSTTEWHLAIAASGCSDLAAQAARTETLWRVSELR